jgi:dCTP deaminase
MLSRHAIEQALETGQIVIRPFNPEQLNPNSYNVRLAPYLKVYRRPPWYSPRRWGFCLDVKQKPPVEELRIPPEGMVLRPGRLYLASTEEYTEAHGLVPCLEGRSSLGRLGLFIHATAGFGDDGFCGHWTMELSVVEPLRIYAGIQIGQLTFTPLVGQRDPYQGKYQRQGLQPVESRIYQEYKQHGSN